MKKTKLFITLALVFMLLFSYVMPAIAAEGDDDEFKHIAVAEDAKKVQVDAWGDHEGATPCRDFLASVTIDTANPNDGLAIFKVVDIVISNNEVKYTFNDAYKSYFEGKGVTIDDYVNITKEYHTNPESLKSLLGGFSAYALKNLEGDIMAEKVTTDDTGSATFKQLPLGQYIVAGTGNSKNGSYIYQTVSIEIVPFVENSKYYVYDKYQVTMKTSEPLIRKEIATIEDYKTNETIVVNSSSTTANKNDEINYNLFIDVPVYPNGSTNTTMYVQDEMSEGLTLNGESIKVYGITFEEDDYDPGTELTEANGEIKLTNQYDNGYQNGFFIDFNYEKVKEYVVIRIEYSASLQEATAQLGVPKVGDPDPNRNNAYCIYSNAPFVGETQTNHQQKDTNGYLTKDAYAYVYTYGLQIVKYDGDTEGENKVFLPGAAFTVYRKVGDEKIVVDMDGETDENGAHKVIALAAGTYYVRESTAPAGYKLNDELYEVVIGPENATETVDGRYGFKTIEIPNTKGGTLPSTGGMGTVIFTVVGIALAGGAALLLITKKRMNNMSK